MGTPISWHPLHSTILSFSGWRQQQWTLKHSLYLNLVLHHWMELMFVSAQDGWCCVIVTGESPVHSEVTKASANSPNHFPPLELHCRMVICLSLVHSNAAIRSLMLTETSPPGKLSKTWTWSAWQPMFETLIQWLFAMVTMQRLGGKFAATLSPCRKMPSGNETIVI